MRGTGTMRNGITGLKMRKKIKELCLNPRLCSFNSAVFWLQIMFNDSLIATFADFAVMQ
ncbi:hypothetical protein ACU8KH_05485 [Lachancea thermotolerans]